MSSPEAALVQFLSVPTVTAIVGTRIYWDKLPQGVVYPALRLQRISTPWGEHRTMEGPADYAKPRFQVDCWALSRHAAINLAQAVFTALEGAGGIIGDLRIDPLEVEDEAGDLEEGIGPGSSDVYRQRLDVFVPFTPAAVA